MNFFLKDGLNVDPSTLQLLQNSANLPMVAKPLYGIVSDAVYVSGQHRIPYIAVGGNEKTKSKLSELLMWNIRFVLCSESSDMTVKIDFVRKPKRSGSFEDNGNSGGNLDSENEYWYSMNFNFHVPKKKKEANLIFVITKVCFSALSKSESAEIQSPESLSLSL